MSRTTSIKSSVKTAARSMIENLEGRAMFNAAGADFKTASATAGFVTRLNSDGSYAWTQVFDGSIASAAPCRPSASTSQPP